MRPSDDVHSTAGFAAWVRRLLDRSLPEGVHDTEYGTVRRYWIAL